MLTVITSYIQIYSLAAPATCVAGGARLIRIRQKDIGVVNKTDTRITMAHTPSCGTYISLIKMCKAIYGSLYSKSRVVNEARHAKAKISCPYLGKFFVYIYLPMASPDSLDWYLDLPPKMQAFGPSVWWLYSHSCSPSAREEIENSCSLLSSQQPFMLQYILGSWVLIQFLQHT